MERFKSIARNWRVKVAVQFLLGLLPRSLGFRINEWVTSYVRGGLEERIDHQPRYMKGIKNIAMIRSQAGGFSLTGKKVFELGTGWHGIDLVIFYLLGAEQIITIDHHTHLTYEYLTSSINSLFSYPEVIEELRNQSLDENRLSILKETVNIANSLDDLLKILLTEYRIITSREYKDLVFDGLVDLFYSESILQRIPIQHLEDLFGVVSAHLNAEGVVFHRTDQKDINAQSHVDQGLWDFYYLRYSDSFFNLFMSGKFNSQNRLRESDFLKLLEQSGMIPVYLESHYSKADLEKLKDFQVAQRFRGKTLEDLAVKHSKIICRKTLPPDFSGLNRDLIIN